MKIEKCHECGKPMELVKEKYEGIMCESYHCSKCKISIFTQEQALAFGKQYQQKLLKEKYAKHPIKIGHSYGVIFPRDLVRVFNLDSNDTKLNIKADRAKNKIEITVL